MMWWRLLDWLIAVGCTQVAIESTGVYWRPVFNILESSLEVLLVNGGDAKGFTARTTDVIDAGWLADAARVTDCSSRVSSGRSTSASCGRRARYRESLVREQTALSNRIQKLIEAGTIKLSQVVSEALGVGKTSKGNR